MTANDTQTTTSESSALETETLLHAAMQAAFEMYTLAECISVANKAGKTILVDDLAKMIRLRMTDVGNDLDVHIADLGLA